MFFDVTYGGGEERSGKGGFYKKVDDIVLLLIKREVWVVQMAGECQGEDDLNKKIGKINSDLFG